jgi:Protein of unknown function (DUF1501)
MRRRDILQLAGNGFGLLGAARILQGSAPNNSLAVKAPHFTPKAKRVIFLFLNGGLSQVDTFDPKPMLTKRHGEPMPGPKIKTDRASGSLMRSPFQFSKCGRSGIEVSEIFPKVGARIDDFAVIRSMYSDNGNHGPSLLMMNSGHGIAGRPAMGSWLTYGLGTENENLPGFVALCPGYPVLGPQLWSSGFLPSIYQGTYVRNSEKDLDGLLPNIRNSRISVEQQTKQLGLLEKLNGSYVEELGSPELESAIASMEVAFRMQTEAPETFDITKEPAHVRERYGDHDFGRGCLMALRMAEKGVRMVQVYFGNFQPWDSHDDIGDHAKLARIADAPIAALVEDLKLRGLFEDTLLIVGSEFGRTPMIQNSGLEKVGNGRDHNVHGFTTLLAGGGIKGGVAYGATDEFGFKAVEDKVHVHDLHATALHLLGLDHTRLTYRYSGRDFRLTDVHGQIVNRILA